MTASTSATPTVIRAAMSLFPMIVIWAAGLSGEARVVTQPRSIATSKPNRSTKKSRVSAGRSERMLGTALPMVMIHLLGAWPPDQAPSRLR